MERQTPGVRAIFDQAREIDSPDERAAFLDHACAHTPEVRAEVEALLRAGAAAGSFLETPAVGRLAGGLPGGSGADDTRTGPAAPADEPLDFLEPSEKPGSIGRLGHYEVQEVVGRGGMGVVLKAFDENLHRVVAVKVMAPQLAASATARQRFTREARAAAAVTHDHVVTIHAVEETNGLPYIVMQFVDGVSLQDRIDRTGPLRLAEVLRIGMQAASGLTAAHAQGLVHRDVKPANILLENGVERVKLTDFGLARAADDASLTQSGTVAGTPSFMSPEQAEGKPVDHRSDLFSLGSVLYAMCTGRPPFRASTNMGVLKRVCEDTPTPVREANPDVPDWLAAIIERLHAKNPSDRYQSAAGVAELLGRHLAHVQHPSVVSLNAFVKPADGPPAPARRSHGRRWTSAAAVLVATLAILGATEAAGVTNVRATVIRIFTPEGTLVVETDDPSVKVVVEGDGDLVITGAGPQEVRLKAGSYRLKATRDGKPVKLDRDLVAISRNGREIVRVRLEDEPVAAVATKTEPGAFVLLGGKGVAERKFDTLAEAVLSSADGDTIEVRGNGPFVTEPVDVRHSLTIRAVNDYRPVFTDSPRTPADQAVPIRGHASLRLEGLTFRCSRALGVVDAAGPLAAANCRFVSLAPMSTCIFASNARIRNCEVLCPLDATFGTDCSQDGHLEVANCILVGHFNLTDFDQKRGAECRFTANTFVSPINSIWMHILMAAKPRLEDPLPKRVRLFAARNVFSSAGPAYMFLQQDELKPHLSAADAEVWLRRRMEWIEDNNCYQVLPNGWIAIRSEGVEHFTHQKSLETWNAFWGLKGTGSSDGVVRFYSGDLNTRAAADIGKLTPEDFRLRPDSAGYHAGKDKKDLGADVDLVGPGPAYERWKKTTDYRQWLKDTGQVKK